jgi:hypothetical protein
LIIDNMDRTLDVEKIEGEIALVIKYKAGESHALDVLQGAMALVESLDRLDHVLLSSVSTSLEPVSILNDIEKSSLKLLLTRVLRSVPDEHLHNPDWKKWLGALLVKGKHILLQRIDADAPEIMRGVELLADDYKRAPGLAGYEPPRIADVQDALDGVAKARARFPKQPVLIQTELGDIDLPETLPPPPPLPLDPDKLTFVVNKGREFFKIKQPDMLGNAQWSVLRNGRAVRVDILHKSWLESYQNRDASILPGDSFDCMFEETITYDDRQNEIDRRLAIVEVLSVISPPQQDSFI